MESIPCILAIDGHLETLSMCSKMSPEKLLENAKHSVRFDD